MNTWKTLLKYPLSGVFKTRKVDLAIIESTLLLKPESFSLNSDDVKQTLTANPTDDKLIVIASLEAGQSISIPISSNFTSSDKLDTPVVKYAQGDMVRKLSWLNGRLVFAGESLEEVVLIGVDSSFVQSAKSVFSEARFILENIKQHRKFCYSKSLVRNLYYIL